MESYLSSSIRILDILLVAMILWGGYKGFKKGFLIELISTLVLVVGVLLVFFLIAQLFLSTDEYIGKSPKLTKFGMYIGVFIVGSIFLNKLGRVLQDKIDYSVFDDFDNIAGAVLGAMKYMVYLSMLLGLLHAAGLHPDAQVMRDSVIYNMLLRFQEWMVEIGAIIAPSIGELSKNIKKMLGQP